MKWKLKFKDRLYTELQNYLFSIAPKENGCFILANVSSNILFVKEIIYPNKKDDLLREEGLCAPNPNYISDACIKADIQNEALLFVHSHPEDKHPSTFSYLDDISNEKMFKNISSILDNPIGSLVFSKNKIHGVIFSNSKYYKIKDYTVLSKGFKTIPDARAKRLPVLSKEYDRQILFLKESQFDNFRRLKIAVIGLGGIGSPLATMLAKMGVLKLHFFDFDKIEIHNLPRIYGATKKDIGQYKVDVIKKHIETFSNCRIKTKKFDVTKNPRVLSKYDIIFGCLDNHTARSILNDISIDYAIPYIDAGCAIPLDENGNVLQAVTALTTVMPTCPCLWCTGSISAMKIMEESLTKEEMQQRRKDGYTDSIEKAPSVISLTTNVATAAINRLFNLIGVYSENYPIKIIYDVSNNIFIESKVEFQEKCKCNVTSPFKLNPSF